MVLKATFQGQYSNLVFKYIHFVLPEVEMRFLYLFQNLSQIHINRFSQSAWENNHIEIAYPDCYKLQFQRESQTVAGFWHPCEAEPHAESRGGPCWEMAS